LSLATLPVFIVLIGLLVLVHELGHFFFARLFGVTVYEFSIGFGPVLTQKKRNDILYSLRAVPLGGFVKIAGMDIALEGETEKKPGEYVFGELPLWKKTLVILAGPLNNLILAMLTFIFIAAALGLPFQLQSDRALIGFVEPKSPAYEAGLSPGDEIIEINGETINRWEQITGIIHNSPRKKLTVKIKRDEAVFTREIIPIFDPALDAGRIGILPAYVVKKLPVLEAIRYGVSVTGYQIVAIPVSLFNMLRGKERAQFLGPIGMVGVIDQALKSGLYLFFSLVASFNLFLGIFNLLPIPLPLLDGGWIVIIIVERLRGKEFTPEQKATAQMIGLLLVMAFYLSVIFGDITSILRRLLQKS
jgi:regulator of sigma E protease